MEHMLQVDIVTFSKHSKLAKENSSDWLACRDRKRLTETEPAIK